MDTRHHIIHGVNAARSAANAAAIAPTASIMTAHQSVAFNRSISSTNSTASGTSNHHGKSNGTSPPPAPQQQHFATPGKSWTDDLPVCHAAAIGCQTNARYRADGSRQEQHPFDDRSFHCRIDEQTSIYAVFAALGDGGAAVAEAALQRVAAEILLGQLTAGSTDDEVRDVLRQAFVAVERGYAESIDTMLAKQAMLRCELEGISQYEISRQYQAIVDQLNHINRELAIGASVVLALIHRGRLYICNVGSCRALLCKNDANGVLRVIQLSVEHNLHNEDEVLRMSQMGVDVETVAQTPFFTTRCIGAYAGKGGYRDCSYLSAASTEPIASEPEIVGAIPLDDSCRFLLLMSSGLCRALYDICADPDGCRGIDDAAADIIATNKECVQLAVEEFRVQSTLSGVAQASVNRVAQMHHDSYMRRVHNGHRTDDDGVQLQRRDDITLLVRNFNFPMPNAIQRRGAPAPMELSIAGGGNQGTLLASSAAAGAAAAAAAAAAADGVSVASDVPDYFHTNTTDGRCITDTNSSTNSLAFRMERDRKFDKNYRIEAYVDFSEFNRRFQEAKERGMLPKRLKDVA